MGESVYQFCALCFSLSMAPQVFTRVMAPVSAVMHRHGFQILRYLDDWLVLASTFQESVWARDFLLWLCQCLGIRVNLPKSSLTPMQTRDYHNDSDSSFEGFPNPQADPEALSFAPGLSVHPVSSGVRLEAAAGDHVLDVCSGSRLQASDAVSSAPPECCRSSGGGRLPGGLGLVLPSGSSVVVQRLSSPSRYASRRVPP